ncbi:MAG: sigma-70 family RNA polymerase sigma factor [Planctomycetes bacterium]|nr:sigma-70 family RNA polymerase sigma factor [Planctomycetota bacterium]
MLPSTNVRAASNSLHGAGTLSEFGVTDERTCLPDDSKRVAPRGARIDTHDPAALNALIDRCLPWIQGQVRARLGPRLREKAESGDIVQEALLRFVKYCPRLGELDERGFCSLMARIVENSIRDQAGWMDASCRDSGREVSGRDASAVLGGLAHDHGTPSRILGDREGMRIAQFALRLLGATDRYVIVQRIDGVPHRDIAVALGISEEAALSRHRRAQLRLVKLVKRLEQGNLANIEWEDEEGE